MKKISTKWATLTILALIVTGAVWHASQRVPAGPDAGTEIHNQGAIISSESERTSFRIGLFNIHGCKGKDRRRDVGRVAECVPELDFLALCEVRGNRFQYPPNQAENLAKRLDRAWLFAPTSRMWFCKDFGNGLLTAMRVEYWHRIPLPQKYDYSFRNVVLVGLKHRENLIHVLVTHITQRDDRERQAQLGVVTRLFLSLAKPSILVGDLNTKPNDPMIRALLDMPDVDDPLSEKSYPGRVDWIITHGLHAKTAEIVNNGASDHPLIWAELEVVP